MSYAKRPDWVPENADDSFSTHVLTGVESSHDGLKKDHLQKKFVKKREVPIEDYVEGVLQKDRTKLAQAITLIESNARHHFEKAQKMIQQLLPYTGDSIRIGITGVPGAGKSTFIEAFGKFLCEQGHRVAVLAVDPSSSISGGSILGDKTRMEQLARDNRAFIRPSPSGGTLGGVNRKTRETILLCEAAGFDVILVETVGVGQSEVVVRSMVDFFLLLVLTGAGDELQGMKKGIIELADAIIINKADGNNKQHALATKSEYNRFLRYLRPATEGWKTKAYTCSALHHEGIDEVWNVINQFKQTTESSGVFHNRRKAQIRDWLYAMIKEQLEYRFFHHQVIKDNLPILENKVMAGHETATSSVQQLFRLYDQAISKNN